MKSYIKPMFTVSVFDLNESIAACSASETYNPVRVDCVISNHHHIFYDNCTTTWCNRSGCDGGIDYEDATIVEYNSAEYLVWKKQGRAKGDDHGNNVTIQDILKEGEDQGLFQKGTSNNWMDYHAGKITPDIQNVINASV